MPGVTFDRAADIYDSTRGFAPGVDEQVRDAIVAQTHATPQTRFLELGVGTGRIALPFIRAGFDYTGVDLSQPMMDQLTRKVAVEPGDQMYQYHLQQADVTQLPFAGDSFDVALAVHVLHLVEGWQQALQETRRVLRKPGGQLLIAYETHAGEGEASARRSVDAEWGRILRDLGVNREAITPGIRPSSRQRPNEVLTDYLHDLGAQTKLVTLLEYETPPLTPRQMAQRHIDRIFSSDWQLSDEIHAAAVQRLQAWLESECPDPDEPISIGMVMKALEARW